MSEKTLAQREGHEITATATRIDETGPSAANTSEVPVDVERYARRGLIFLFVTLISFGLWAVYAPLSSAIIAVGEIVVDSNRKSIQHYEGGIIEQILVRDGEYVEAGTPLVQLETTQWQADLSATRERMHGVKAELERLMAEQNFRESLAFSEELQQIALHNPDLRSMLHQQTQLHSARIKAHLQHRRALETRIEQIQRQITGLEQEANVHEQHIASLQEEEQAFSALHHEGLGDGQRARELRRAILQLQNELTRANTEASRLAIQSTEAELELANHMQNFLTEVAERTKEQQTEYFTLQEQLRVAEDRLRRATIRAPENGIIVDLQVHTIGGVIGGGNTLLDLVPVEDYLVVEAKIMPQDINDVYLGQLADIRFSAFKTQLTQVVEAEITYLSADRLLDERDGAPYYLARLRVTEEGQKHFTDDIVLRAGMPAEVMIRGEERTLLSYLLKPITDSMARGMKEY